MFTIETFGDLAVPSYTSSIQVATTVGCLGFFFAATAICIDGQ